MQTFRSQCTPLLNPLNGMKHCTMGDECSSECYFTCLPGFSLSDNATQTCTAEGGWTGYTPKCIRESCT